MTKSKTCTVKAAPKAGTISKDKAAKAVAAVLSAPSSSKADKTVKGSALASKVKKPTLKEQVASLQYQYDEQCKDYQNLINECSYKDMEIANLKQEVLTLKKDCADYCKAFNEEMEITIGQQRLINCLNTPWYTKLINFLKGD